MKNSKKIKLSIIMVFLIGLTMIFKPLAVSADTLSSGSVPFTLSSLSPGSEIFQLDIVPTLNAPTATGTGYYGDPVNVAATGTNIAEASIRVYYTRNVTAPTVPAQNGDPTTTGWVDSNVVYASPNITSGSVTYTAPGSDFRASDAWTYVTFKIWVASSTTAAQTWNFTPAYRLSSLPPTVTTTQTLIDHLASNQLIVGNYSRLETTGSNRTVIPAVDLYTPAEPYNTTDATQMTSHLMFQNGDIVKYRFEFNAVDASRINDIESIIDFNSGNEDAVNVRLLSADLYKGTQRTSSAYPGQSYYEYALIKPSLAYNVVGRNNRYKVSLGNDDSGDSIIQANGNTRYAIEVTGRLVIYQLPNEIPLLNSMFTEVLMKVYAGTYTATLDPDAPDNKNYIQTCLTRIGASLR